MFPSEVQVNRAFTLRTFTFVIYMTQSVVVSFFPIYFDSLGFSKVQIGLIYSSGPLVAIGSNLIWGLASDRLQTLKKTIIAVLVGQLAMILCLIQASAFSFVFPLMAAFYFFQMPLSGLNDSQLLIASKQKGKSYASFRVMGSIGFAFAAAVFGLFLKNEPPSSVTIAAIGTVVVSLTLAFVLRDARASGRGKIDFTGFRSVFFAPKLLIFLLLTLLMFASVRVNDGFLAIYMHQLGADQGMIGLAWMTSALSEIPGFFLMSKYGHKWKELPLLSIAALAYSVRFVIAANVTSPAALVAVQLMHSVSFGIFMITALRYLQQVIPDRFRATGQAMYQIVTNGFSGLIAGTAGGAIFDAWGGRVMFWFASYGSLLAAIGFLTFAIISNRSDATVASLKRSSRNKTP